MKTFKSNSRYIVLTLLFLTIVVLVIKPLISISFLIPKDYNEGFHALLAMRAFGEGPLYTGPSSLISNGYTPVSFYIVGGLGAILGDNIIAGRVIALLSLCVVAISIGFVVHRISRSVYAALFSTIVFVGYIAVYHANYIGMNDPQWLAQAIMMLGFSLFMIRGESYRLLLWVILIMVAAGMTKHILIPLPLAITIWLFLHDRQQFYMWLLSGILVLIGCLGWLYVTYGPEFFANLLALRPEYSYVTVLYRIKNWLVSLSPFLGALLIYLLIEPAGRYKQLLLVYISVAAIWGFLLSGGVGIDMNHIYDLIIGLVIVSGLTIYRLGERLQQIWHRDAVESVSAVILSLTVLVALPSKAIEARWAFSDLERRESSVAEDIRYLSAQEGPVLCETLALCYWAGKSYEGDIMVLSLKLKSGALSEAGFKYLVDSHYFKVIQLHDGGAGGTTRRLSKEVNAYILEKYEVHPNKMGGAFLVPAKVGDATGVGQGNT